MPKPTSHPTAPEFDALKLNAELQRLGEEARAYEVEGHPLLARVTDGTGEVVVRARSALRALAVLPDNASHQSVWDILAAHESTDALS